MKWTRKVSIAAGSVGMLGALYLALTVIWGPTNLPFGKEVFATATALSATLSAFLGFLTLGKQKAEEVLKDNGLAIPFLPDLEPAEKIEVISTEGNDIPFPTNPFNRGVN